MAERHPEIDAEQAHLDWAYACLDEARARAARVTQGYDPQRGGTEQHRHERESIVEGAVNRLTQLNLGDRSLVFGRIDPAGTGERFHIGRLGVWDRNQDPVVVDWRAPVAEPFYRATGREPMGIERRRHFATRGRTLLGIDDEVFGELASADGEREIKGQGALIAAIEASRTGRLGDIVATIQGEQDEIIRAPMPGVLLVQGGPGTGKTVVALHRAAYLLYTHRFPLEGQGVLVVGPNRLFLAYIEQVLPSLGEAGVEIAVLGDLLRPRVRVDGLAAEAVAAVKGDLRMTDVLAQAVSDRERPLRSDVAIGFGIHRLKLTVADSCDIIRDVRRRSKGHNAGRKIVEELVFAKLAASARRPVEASAVRDQLRWELPVRELLEWMWPVLTPAHLLHDLFGSRALLRSANRKGHFTDEEILRLHQPRAPHADDVVWHFADVPLLDEARALLGYRPGKRDEDALRTYGHICIDEAQDLAPMELRMIGRRSLNGSMTVVGDIAQATGAWANDGWDNVLAQLPQKHDVHRRELSIGYRIPGPAMLLANRVLPYAAPGLRPPQPVRDDGDPPRRVRSELLDEALVETVLTELEAVDEGNVAVIVPDSMVDEVRSVFEARELSIGGANRYGLDQRITLVPVRLVKGLEVDSAVVVEPARIIDEESQGIRSLYVALTRATKRVAVVHSRELPAMLQE